MEKYFTVLGITEHIKNGAGWITIDALNETYSHKLSYKDLVKLTLQLAAAKALVDESHTFFNSYAQAKEDIDCRAFITVKQLIYNK